MVCRTTASMTLSLSRCLAVNTLGKTQTHLLLLLLYVIDQLFFRLLNNSIIIQLAKKMAVSLTSIRNDYRKTTLIEHIFGARASR